MKHLGEVKKQLIVKLKREGLSLQVIAERAGVSVTTVYRTLKKMMAEGSR